MRYSAFNINNKFLNLRTELAKDSILLQNLMGKMMDGKELNTEEKTIIAHAQAKAMPIYIGMLEVMIEEPKMSFEEVRLLIDAVDEYDRETLMAYVNTLTSEKAIVAQQINQERTEELNKMRSEMMTGV